MVKTDLIRELGDSRKYTLHSHTQYCDGRYPMAGFAATADRWGFTHYGFTPHSPIPFDSPCNMSADDVPAYLAEADRLQAMYPEVKFYKGMEIDYIDDSWGPANDYFRSLPLDYSIGSVHFIPTQDGRHVDIDGRYESFERKMHEDFHDDIRYVVDTYFDQVQRMVAAGGFDIIGHFDKIKHNGGHYLPGLEDTDWYKSRVDDLIDSIIASGVIVEINTKSWREHRQMFPAQRHWRRLLQAGVPIVVNSDAHYPELINASRDEAFRALDYLRAIL